MTYIPGTHHPTLLPGHSCTSLPCCPLPSLLGAPYPSTIHSSCPVSQRSPPKLAKAPGVL